MTAVTPPHSTATYKEAWRGTRLDPSPGDPMYRHLLALAETLTRVIRDLPRGETVLDFGCGNRPYERLVMERFSRYIGADLPGSPHADVALGALGALPLEDNSVDCVLSSQVLEHARQPRAYLAEARRVLRSGGHLVLSTHGMWQYHPDPGDYWRWTHDGLREELTDAGFNVVRVESAMGRVSTALQLLQDALIAKLPRFPRRICITFFQSLIGLSERSRGAFSEDAAVYVIVGRG